MRKSRSNFSITKSDVDKAPCPPKVARRVQSTELLKQRDEEQRDEEHEYSPGTPYYSPSKDPGQALDPKPKKPKSKSTAVKARAKPGPKKAAKPAKDRKTPAQEAPEPRLKPEQFEDDAAKAVQDALRRGGTADLPPTPSSPKKKTPASPNKKKASPEKKKASPEKKKEASPEKKKKESPEKKKKASPEKKKASSCSSKSSDSGSEEERDDGSEDRELTLQQLKAKKAAHARCMRFSRSLKSKRALPAYLA